MNKELEKNNRIVLSFYIGAIIGAVVFILIYGIKVLDVTYDDFLMSYHLDLTQHYLGWRMYRNSSWHFPIGLCDTNIYPYMSSVVYTDSIPLFAVIFKLLSPVLPSRFQYFGLFGIICFMLQGGMASLLLRKRIKNIILIGIGSLFFVTGIVFVNRMFWQTALSAHFLILAAFVLYAYRKELSDIRKIVLWTILGVLSVSIHFYLYGMVSVLFGGFCLLESLYKLPRVKDFIKTFLSYMIVYLAATISIFFLLGGFYGTVNVAKMYDEPAGADINGLFESMGLSSFFVKGDVVKLESFCYIGIGVGILFIPSVFFAIYKIKEKWKSKKIEIVIYSLLFLFFVMFSLSPTVMFNDETLFNITFIPDFIVQNSWGLFRNCGRFMWPVMYFIMYIAISYSENVLKKSYPYVLTFVLFIQLFEFGGYYKKRNDIIDSLAYRVCPADFLYSYDLNGIKHIQFMQNYIWDDYYSDEDCFYQFVGYSRLAMDKGMTVSNFHFARDYDYIVQEQIDKCAQKLMEGKPDKDTIYVYSRKIYDSKELHGKYINVKEIVTDWDVVLIPQ